MTDRKIGAQLYTVRNLCQNAADFDRTLSRLEKIGYKQVQISGIGDIAPEEIKRICDAHGMNIVCTHKGEGDYESRMEDMIAFHKAIGCDIAGLGHGPVFMQVETADEVCAEIAKLNGFSRELAKAGICFCYHNHATEFRKIDGKYIMDYMLEEGEFDFIVDVYWLAYAAQNPAEFIRRIGKRAKIVHFKDLSIGQSNNALYTEVGEGNLDWADIIAACDEAGTLAAMVEQDECPHDPVDSLEISYKNLTKFGFN